MRDAVRRLALLLLALSAPGLLAAQQPSAAAHEPAPAPQETAVAPADAFDDFVEALMEEWHVPGLAVGAIQDGEVTILKGYGLRNMEEQQPVTPQTLLAIGSNSKSFTVVLMSQLVDEGQLDWDAPVRQYLPDFQLHDDYATENMRVKDLVTHVSGLPRHDGLWYGRSADREELFSKLRYLEPTTTFRGRWQYQNLMFMTAGLLVERITGRSWDDLIRERIFEPLEMTRSNTSTNDMPGSGDFSYPYVYTDEGLQRVPFRNIDNVGPAGSINSSVEEMLHYVQMHIGLGEWNGERILSEDNAKLMQSPQSVATGEMPDPEVGPSTYGLALSISSYRGHKWVQHGGGIDGFISQMGWLPNEEIGVVVLSNMSGEANPVPDLVVQRVFDDLLGLDPIDWNARTRQRIEEGEARQAEREREREESRVEGTSPSHALDAYAGTYSHPAHGDLRVTVAGGALEMHLDDFSFPLEHFHYDVFDIDAEPTIVPFSGQVQFRMNKAGEIDAVLVPLEPAVADFVFERQEM